MIYYRVCRAGEFRPQKGLPWMFKLVYVLDEKGKVHYFSASSETEMKVGLSVIYCVFIYCTVTRPNGKSVTDHFGNTFITTFSITFAQIYFHSFEL